MAAAAPTPSVTHVQGVYWFGDGLCLRGRFRRGGRFRRQLSQRDAHGRSLAARDFDRAPRLLEAGRLDRHVVATASQVERVDGRLAGGLTIDPYVGAERGARAR